MSEAFPHIITSVTLLLFTLVRFTKETLMMEMDVRLSVDRLNDCRISIYDRLLTTANMSLYLNSWCI